MEKCTERVTWKTVKETYQKSITKLALITQLALPSYFVIQHMFTKGLFFGGRHSVKYTREKVRHRATACVK